MSKFAQLITSFERTGNFPLEANYIFATVEDLKEFYSDPIQAATMHKGMLRLVERNPEGNQALYWVTKKETKNELEFTELIAGKDITEIETNLDSYLKKLDEEITARKNAVIALWGVTNPSEIDEEYNSINDLGIQLKAVRESLNRLNEESLSGDKSLKNQLKNIVGTTDNDVVAFMQTLPFSTIKEISIALDRIINGKKDEETGEPIETDTIDTLPELSAFLEGYTNKDTLEQILTALWNTIEGEILPTTKFRTLRGIEDYIIEYRTANDYKQKTLLEEMNNLETGVGLNPDGSYSPDVNTNYLQNATSVMNALQILDKTLHRYVSANVPSVRDTDDAIKLTLTQELDSYVIAAALKLSTQAGNQIIKNSDGLYSSAKTYYENGVLTFRVNGNIVSQHYIGMNAIVQDARYDKDNEQLEFVFKLDNGDTQKVLIPVGALIREWEPYNKEHSAVILERYESVSGTDRLSADVRISEAQWNILQKIEGALYVKGTSDNIYHGGMLLSKYLEDTATDNAEFVKTVLKRLEDDRIDRETIKSDLEIETTTRQTEDEKLGNQIKSVNDAVKSTQDNLSTETSERQKADNNLSNEIKEADKRASTEENRLQLAITGEAERAKQAEEHLRTQVNGLGTRLTEEVDRATKKDIELENKINNITHDSYSIEKQSTPEAGCIATYLLTRNGVHIGNKIDIPEVPVSVSLAYEKGLLTLIVNGAVAGTAAIGLNSVVDDSQYDPESEEIVTIYNLHDGSTQTVRTSLARLISTIRESRQAELDKKAPVDSPILKGIPQVETSPDNDDSSQRIPSTAWVMARIAEAGEASSGTIWIDVD